MKIDFTSKFRKSYKKRISKNPLLVTLFEKKLERFSQDAFAPELETHKLSGNLKDYWAFSVAPDCRVVFTFEDNNKIAILADIGKHDEVY